MTRLTVIGGGGTDFRPAFAYVNELLEQGGADQRYFPGGFNLSNTYLYSLIYVLLRLNPPGKYL